MTPDYTNALYTLYESCLWASPDESIKRGFKRLIREITAPDWHGDDAQASTRALAGALYDGLAFGNWPSE